MIHWNYFRFCKLLVVTYIVPNQNMFSPFPSTKAWKGVYLALHSLKIFLSQHHTKKQIFNVLSTNLHLIFLQLNSRLSQHSSQHNMFILTQMQPNVMSKQGQPRSTQVKVHIRLPEARIKATKIGPILVAIHPMWIKMAFGDHNQDFLIITFFNCHHFQQPQNFQLSKFWSPTFSITTFFNHHKFFITKVLVTTFFVAKVSITTFFRPIFFSLPKFQSPTFQLSHNELSQRTIRGSMVFVQCFFWEIFIFLVQKVGGKNFVEIFFEMELQSIFQYFCYITTLIKISTPKN